MDRLAHLYHEFGQSPWLDNLKRGYITSGQLQRLIGHGIRGLTSNPTIFQKAIPGSADYDEQFTAAGRRRQADHRRLLGDGPARHQLGARRVRPRVPRQLRRRRLRQRRGRPGAGPRRRRHRGRGARAARADRPSEPDGQDPRHGRGPRPDPDDDRRGPQHQRHVDLHARPLRRGDGVVHRRPRDVRQGARARTCPRSPAWPASSSAGWTPRSTAGSTRSARPRRWRCAARARSPRASSPTSCSCRRSAARAGRRSPPRAPRCSGRCGPARRRRTRRTRTRCTSTS